MLFQCLLQRPQVSRVDHGSRDAHLGQHGLNKLAGAAVAVRGGHNVAARRHQRQQHCGGSIHSRRRHQTVLRPLQPSNLLLTGPRCWVAIAPILIAAIAALLISNQLRRVPKRVCGSLDDGRCERVCSMQHAAHGRGQMQLESALLRPSSSSSSAQYTPSQAAGGQQHAPST